MTEESFQQARKIMQQANYLRGQITKAKGEVAKWTKIEDSYRQNMKPSSADGAKKMLDKAMKNLDEKRQLFNNLKFPAENLVKVIHRCVECGKMVKEGQTYCSECLNEDSPF